MRLKPGFLEGDIKHLSSWSWRFLKRHGLSMRNVIHQAQDVSLDVQQKTGEFVNSMIELILCIIYRDNLIIR
jgi:hypothetical protein